MRVPAVVYAAKSTEDRQGSIPTQTMDCRKMAEAEGWEIHVEEQDEGFSAYSGNRGPGLEKAKRAAEELAEKFGEAILVAQHSDRIARGAGDSPDAADHLVEVLSWARRHNVRLRTVQDDMFADERFSLIMAAMMGQRNTEDSRRKSLAVKAGHARRRARGRSQGGKRRYGFEFVKGELIPVAAEVAIVKRIIREVLTGESQSSIARKLEAEGVPTANGGKWYQATISEITRNPIYIGKLATKEGVIDGAHDPVIDPEEWQKAQDLLGSRASKGKGRPTAGRHLFRKGMLRCGLCGEAMVPRTTRRKGKTPYEVYQCYGRERLGVDACSMKPVKRSDIDLAVYRYFEQVGLDVEATREQLASSRDEKLREVRLLLDQAKEQKRLADARLARVRSDYTNGALPVEDWMEFKAELQPQAEAAQAEGDRLNAQLAEVQAWGEFRDVEQETLESLAELRRIVAGEVADTSGIDGVRAVLARLFAHFTLKRVEPGMKIHAELAWQGDLIIEPTVAARAIVGYTSLRPILRQEPVPAIDGNQASPSSSRPRRRPMGCGTRSTPRNRSRPRRT